MSDRDILLIGSGVFGLSITHELLQRPKFKGASITLLSPTLPSSHTAAGFGEEPSYGGPHIWTGSADLTASRDTTRIVRGDYADPAYASLAREALELWRGEWGGNGRYKESGLLLTADEGTPGAEYVAKSLKNVQQSVDASAVQEMKSPEDVARGIGFPGVQAGTGHRGYLNGRSGLVDPSASMDWLYRRIAGLSHDHLKFEKGAAERLTLSRDGERISGCVTTRGEIIQAGITILAMGAWTSALVDTRGIASATGHPVAYVEITAEEANQLRSMPVHLNLSGGCFVFPPTPLAAGAWEIKLARHSFGLSNPIEIPAPVSTGQGTVSNTHASVPVFPQALPAEDERALLNFMRKALPPLAASPTTDRRIKQRICWYLDTHSGDFLVCWHPSYRNSLFLATGDSGHAFKFLPALGNRVVDVLDGSDESETGGLWTRKWQWPEPLRDGRGDLVDTVWCQDGSRSGAPGRTLHVPLHTGPKEQKSKL